MTDARTLAFYESEAPVYSASGPDGASRHLDEFLNLLPSGARILELGCGGGRDALHMIERGFEVDATDGTAAMASITQRRIGQSARVLRFEELNAQEEYHAVWAHASLLHVPVKQLPSVIEKVHEALIPGGWHFANFKIGSGEGRDELGRLFNFPTTDQLKKFYLDAASWSVLEYGTYAGSGYDSMRRTWMFARAQK